MVTHPKTDPETFSGGESEEYAGHFFLALLYAKDDPDRARAELAVVAELNPLEPRIDAVRERIDHAEPQRR